MAAARRRAPARRVVQAVRAGALLLALLGTCRLWPRPRAAFCLAWAAGPGPLVAGPQPAAPQGPRALQRGPRSSRGAPRGALRRAAAKEFPAERFPTSKGAAVCAGDGLSEDLLRSLPANLPQSAAPVVPPKAPRNTTLVYKVEPGGKVSEEGTRLADLWRTGALVVVVRRPGCAMCREQAFALTQAFSAVVASQELPGMPRLIALVRSSLVDNDGSSEVDAFREYFPGEVYVDPYLATFKALGDRQYTDGVYSEASARWMLQRMAGMQRRTVAGNFVGGPDTALKFGGCYVFDRAGEVRFVHQEGLGSINYEAVRNALAEL